MPKTNMEPYKEPTYTLHMAHIILCMRHNHTLKSDIHVKHNTLIQHIHYNLFANAIWIWLRGDIEASFKDW